MSQYHSQTPSLANFQSELTIHEASSGTTVGDTVSKMATQLTCTMNWDVVVSYSERDINSALAAAHSGSDAKTKIASLTW